MNLFGSVQASLQNLALATALGGPLMSACSNSQPNDITSMVTAGSAATTSLPTPRPMPGALGRSSIPRSQPTSPTVASSSAAMTSRQRLFSGPEAPMGTSAPARL